MINELVKIVIYLLKKTELFLEISDDYMEEMFYALSFNPKYSSLFKDAIYDNNQKRILFNDIRNYNPQEAFNKLSHETKEKVLSITKDIIYYLNFSKKASYINCKLLPMDANQIYYIIYTHGDAHKCFRNNYIWQLLTDGEITEPKEINSKNNTSIYLNIPGTTMPLATNLENIKEVKVNNASYAIMHGLVHQKIIEAKIYTNSTDMNFLDNLVDYANIYQNVHYKKLSLGLPSIYQFKI